MSANPSRRKAIKVLGVAGVALVAAPYLAKASALQQLSGSRRAEPSAAAFGPSVGQTSAETLVLVVRGDKVLGYRGLEEIPVQDASLAGMLNGRFSKGVASL